MLRSRLLSTLSSISARSHIGDSLYIFVGSYYVDTTCVYARVCSQPIQTIHTLNIIHKQNVGNALLLQIASDMRECRCFSQLNRNGLSWIDCYIYSMIVRRCIVYDLHIFVLAVLRLDCLPFPYWFVLYDVMDTKFNNYNAIFLYLQGFQKDKGSTNIILSERIIRICSNIYVSHTTYYYWCKR